MGSWVEIELGGHLEWAGWLMGLELRTPSISFLQTIRQPQAVLGLMLQDWMHQNYENDRCDSRETEQLLQKYDEGLVGYGEGCGVKRHPQAALYLLV